MILEEVDADSLSDFSLAVDLGANSYNSPDRLVGGYDGAGRFVYAFHHLVVGMVEPSGSDLDGEVLVSDLRDGNFVYLVLGVVLARNQWSLRTASTHHQAGHCNIP